MAHAEPGGGQGDDDHDTEDQTPRGGVDEPAPRERAEQTRDPRPPGPGSNRGSAILGGEAGLDDRKARRDQQRRSGTLENTGADQHCGARRKSTEQRGEGESDQACREDPPASIEVPERAAGDHQGTEGKQVGVYHPLQAAELEVEVAADCRQCDVDDAPLEERCA
jgi:hypothetical protein